MIEFAADDQTTSGTLVVGRESAHTNKLFSESGLTVGGTGYSYETNLFAHFLRNHRPLAPHQYAVVDLMLEFEEWLAKKRSDTKIQNQYLIAVDCSLFRVYDGLSVFSVPEFEAIGAGEDFAKSALHCGKTPMEACVVACELSIYCSLPIKTMSHVAKTHSEGESK